MCTTKLSLVGIFRDFTEHWDKTKEKLSETSRNTETVSITRFESKAQSLPQSIGVAKERRAFYPEWTHRAL